MLGASPDSEIGVPFTPNVYSDTKSGPFGAVVQLRVLRQESRVLLGLRVLRAFVVNPVVAVSPSRRLALRLPPPAHCLPLGKKLEHLRRTEQLRFTKLWPRRFWVRSSDILTQHI